jgi:hypothetical protein
VTYARAALPWLLAAVFAALCMAALARRVLPKRSTQSTNVAPAAASIPAEARASTVHATAPLLDASARPRALPATTPNAPSPGPHSSTAPAVARVATDPQALARAWQRLDALRARLDALEGDAGTAVTRTAAGALRMLEAPEILEEAGVSDEPFASRLAAYRDAMADGGRGEVLRATIFQPEDAERLRLLDAVDALRRPSPPMRGDAGAAR